MTTLRNVISVPHPTYSAQLEVLPLPLLYSCIVVYWKDVIYVGDVFPNLRTNCPSGLTGIMLDRHQILTQGALPGSPIQGLLVNLHYILYS